MVLTPHLLAGAAIGTKTHNLGLIIILGLLSHLILDRIPHWDYSNPGISNFKKNKSLKALIIDTLKIIADGAIGLFILILIIVNQGSFQVENIFFIALGIFFATLPDILLFFSFVMFPKKIAEKIINFHHGFFHYKKPENENLFAGILLETLITFLIILVFFS